VERWRAALEAVGLEIVDDSSPSPFAPSPPSKAPIGVAARLTAQIRRPGVRQFLRFLMVGGVNTAFGYSVYAAAIFAGLRPTLALACAMVCGVVFNFFTTGRLVFREQAGNAFPRFVLAYGVIYLVNLGLLHLATRLGAGPLLAQALVTPPTVVFTFGLMKLVVFRR